MRKKGKEKKTSLHICKITVQICGNFWVTKYLVQFGYPPSSHHITEIATARQLKAYTV